MNLNLEPSVREILDKVKTLTGKDIRFIEKKDLPTFAGIKVARKDMDAHLLLYNPEHTGIINHLIAHECGHVLRMYTVPVEDRLIPKTDDQTKKRALTGIEGEIEKLSSVLPFDSLAQIKNMWYEGLVQQVPSQPSDVMIEKWLYTDYPALRPYQMQSIKTQRDQALAGLSNEVARMTPRLIVSASNIMNCAFFKLLGECFGTNYVGGYRRTPYLVQGEELARMTKACSDYGGDMENINGWVKFLGLSDWFEWTGFEDVPASYDKIA